MKPFNVADAQQIAIQAGQVFQPRSPISTRELFAGRWDQLTAVVDAVAQTGLHVVIYGERGVGKTSLANVIRPVLYVFDQPHDKRSIDAEDSRLVVKVNTNKSDTFDVLWKRALDEVSIAEERPVLGFSRNVTEKHVVPLREAWNLPNPFGIDEIRRVLAGLPGSVFIFDEFDRADRLGASQFTDLIKALSDFPTPSTVILVGVADTVDGLIEGHASIGRSLVQVHMPRMRQDELLAILKKAEEKLGIVFKEPASECVIRMSLGLPHYTHLAGLASVRKACEALSRTVELQHVRDAFDDASKQAEQSLVTEFSQATRSAHRDAIWAPVLLACAITSSKESDELGYFQPSSIAPPLAVIMPKKKRVEISSFNKHLAEFCTPKRGAVLQRTGQARAFRYRFRNPLLPPYVLLKGLSSGLLSSEQLDQLVQSTGH